MEPTDIDLLGTDFRSLYYRHAGPLLASVRRRWGGLNEHDVDDVVQETFLHLFLARSQLLAKAEQSPCLGGWLRTAAERVAIGFVRRLHSRTGGRNSPASLDDVRLLPGGKAATLGSQIAARSDAGLPGDADPLEPVRRALPTLSEGQRLAVELVRLVGMPAAEAAEKMGLSKGRVNNMLTEARQKLSASGSEEGQ